MSYEAAAVISGITPISLLANERAEIHRGRDKKEARRELIARWQEEWDNGSKGRWTHELIGQLDSWLSRKVGQVTYHHASGRICAGSTSWTLTHARSAATYRTTRSMQFSSAMRGKIGGTRRVANWRWMNSEQTTSFI